MPVGVSTTNDEKPKPPARHRVWRYRWRCCARHRYRSNSIVLLAALLSLTFMPPTSALAVTLLPPACTTGAKACLASGQLTYVSVYGPIHAQDEEQFRALDYLIPRDGLFPLIYVNSPGGGARSAMAIGRILRKRSAEVRTGSPLFPEHAPECSSACVILAAGATRRYLSHVGLHSGYSRETSGCGTWKPVALDGAAIQEFTDYLHEMGLPPKLEEIIKKTPYEKMAHFFLDPKQPITGQMIVTLGFFTGGPQDLKRIPDAAFDEGAEMATQLEYLKNSAEKGPREAAWELVEYLNTAEPAEYRNAELAFSWLQQLADKGDGYAHYVVGNYHTDGFGTLKNPGQALRNYVLAAEQGIGQAQAIVGRAYLLGEGLPRDDFAAFDLSLRAAERGQSMAYSTLCEFYGRQRPGKQGQSLGATWCKLAATSTKDLTALSKLEAIQDDLTLGLSSEDLQKIQDRAINWRPIQEASNPDCAIGAERY
jgi:hypothetical protein